MNDFKIFLLIGAIFFTSSLIALEVDREVMPRITLGGRVMATLDSLEADTGSNRTEQINLEDSTLLLRFDKRLYLRGVAGSVLGISDDHGEARLNQAYVYYWDKNFEVTLGRLRFPGASIEHPFIRDDDLLEYTHIGNGASDEASDHLYGHSLQAQWLIDQKNQSLIAWAGIRQADTAFTPVDGFNSYGLAYRYNLTESLRQVQRLRMASFGWDRQRVDVGAVRESLEAIYAGVEFNINQNPSRLLSLGMQAIRNEGLQGATDLSSLGLRARAASNSAVLSLRFSHRPQLLTRNQFGLSVAYKEYDDGADAKQISIIPSYFYRAGSGVDFLMQYKQTKYGNGLMNGARESSIQFGMAFNFDHAYNDTIGERNSILNIEHGYIR